jgi:hypothetical protein
VTAAQRLVAEKLAQLEAEEEKARHEEAQAAWESWCKRHAEQQKPRQPTEVSAAPSYPVSCAL